MPITTVTNETQLRGALPHGGHIYVDVEGELPLTQPEMVKFGAPGTVLYGAHKNATRLGIKAPNPNDISFYMAAKGITIENLTLDSGFHTAHTVYGDCFNDISGLTLDGVRIDNSNDGVKYVGDMHYPPCDRFTFRNCDIVNHKGKGMFLDVDMRDPVIEGFFIKGFGNRESGTSIWIGQGILGGRIANGKIVNSGYNGVECFYPHTYPTKSQLSRDNPHGPGLMISGIEMDGVANIACSLAGCKRSVISNIHIRNAGSGMEYIDEIVERDGVPLYSDYNAYGVTVAGITGVGVTIHRMKRSRFAHHIMTDCGSFGAQLYDGAENIIFSDSTFQKCGDRMLFANGANNGRYERNEFIKMPTDPGPRWGFYAYGGNHVFSGNVLRGGLETGCSQAQILVAPKMLAEVSGETFTDRHNHRI